MATYVSTGCLSDQLGGARRVAYGGAREPSNFGSEDVFGYGGDSKRRAALKRAFEKKLKSVGAELARNEALPTVRETLVLVLEDDDDVQSGPHTVGGKRFL